MIMVWKHPDQRYRIKDFIKSDNFDLVMFTNCTNLIQIIHINKEKNPIKEVNPWLVILKIACCDLNTLEHQFEIFKIRVQAIVRIKIDDFDNKGQFVGYYSK